MNPIQFFEYGKTRNTGINTFIGGLGATYPTASSLATKLGIPEASIPRFQVVNNEIQARIISDYNPYFDSDTNLTKYIDNDGRAKELYFRYCSNLSSIHFPGANTLTPLSFGFTGLIGDIYFPSLVNTGFHFAFQGMQNSIRVFCPNLETISSASNIFTTPTNANFVFYAPKCTSISSTFLMSQSITSSAYFNIFLATSNGGNEDAVVSAIRTMCRHVGLISNYTTPQNSVLSDVLFRHVYFLNDGQSANPVDYLEIYDLSNNFIKFVYTGHDGLIPFKGLTMNTFYSYKFKAVDVFHNRNQSFGTLSFTTKGPADANFDITGLQHHYEFERTPPNAHDLFNTCHFSVVKDGTPPLNSVGKIGNAYRAVTGTGRIDAVNLPATTTGNFTINVWLYNEANATSTNVGLFNVGNHSTTTGFGLWVNSDGRLNMRINRNFNNGSTATVLPLNQWTMVTYTWDGATMRIYFNTVLKHSVNYAVAPVSSNIISLFQRIGTNVVFLGRVDLASVFYEVINNTRMTDLYNGGLGKTILN